MPEPVTTSLVFLGSAVVSGVLGNRSDAGFKARWDKFRHNLAEHRPYANHELARAAYRAYLQATLQSCAALLQQNNLNVEAWFKFGILPEKMADAFRSLLSDTPAGVFTQANKRWLEAVSQDHVGKLKLLDKEKLDPPFEYEHEEFAELLKEIELLMQPAEARDRERAIREALATRVLRDRENQFGEAPEDFTALVNERWFEFLCAGFQYCIKHQQEVANAFESRLLAQLVARSDWQRQLTDFGGESLKRIEAAQEWLRQEQREGFERIESLVTLLLPLLSFASDDAARNETLALLVRAESDRVIDIVQDESDKTRAHSDQLVGDLKASIEKLTQQPSNTPEPLIHTLPTQQDIEGREEECAIILRAMSTSEEHVLVFAAPGGFGKTALLAKLIQKISADGKTFLDSVALPNGETVETHITALLHVDCRNEVKVGTLFANAGRLVGREQEFQDIYNSELALSDKLQVVLSRLSTNQEKRTWFVFDNLEPLLNDKGEIAGPELSNFFSAIFAGGHGAYVLIAGRDVPRFSPRERVRELDDVGGSLFDGLPLDDCLAYLKKNDADRGLTGTAGEIDGVLKEFALRVHRIPLALVWAVGYLRDTGYTLKEVLEKQYLFADFDQEQARDAERYENKGLKRLHYEQLKIQQGDSLPMLRLLAFFKRAVPKGALAHLLNEIDLNKTLMRLERNKLITRKESADAYTRYSKDTLEVNLYALHPVICENEFFGTLPDNETLYETAAEACWGHAASAYEINHFAHAIELFDCAEKLFEYLTKELRREDLLNNYASMLMNKGVALRGLTRLTEAVAEYDKAIEIRERLVNVEKQAHLANDLATAYVNKGVALYTLTRLTEAVAEYDKAIEIIERLVNVEKQAHLANDLATAYVNKGVALYSLTRLTEAVAEYDKAIAIFERLVNVEKQAHLANDLAAAYMNKGVALRGLTRLTEAVAEYDKAIEIRERLVNVEKQAHLANDLAMAYLNKGNALQNLTRLTEAVAEYDKAIEIIERLVNVEKQAHLANDLAMDYMNKALVLEKQEDWDRALACYEKSLQAWTFCVDQLKMFWIMPQLLMTLRYRLMTLLDLQRWAPAAQDVLRFRSLYKPYAVSETVDDGLKKAAGEEFTRMIARLRALTNEQCKLLYAELGDEAAEVRSLVSGSANE